LSTIHLLFIRDARIRAAEIILLHLAMHQRVYEFIPAVFGN